MLSDWKETCAKCMDGEIEPRQCEYYGEPNGCNSPTYGEHPPVGNAAAMREALEKIYLYAQSICEYKDEPAMVCRRADLIERAVNAALSAPARNCDIYPKRDDAGEAWNKTLDERTRDMVQRYPLTAMDMFIDWLLAYAEDGGVS